MKKTDITFIIPVYNTQNYIKKCVNSILSLNISNYEIIIINDGSTDNSGIMCEELSILYSTIKVIHLRNSGVSYARNTGIKEASGKWIFFVDSDDFLNTNFGAISEYIDRDDIDLIHFGWSYDSKHDIIVSNETRIIKYDSFFREKIFHGYVWSYMFKREIILSNNILFSTDVKYAEDWEFIFKYYSCIHNKILLLKDCIYTQIYREGSATNRKLGEKYICDNFKMYDRVLSIKGINIVLKKCISYHLYSINIWLVNNVIYNDYSILAGIYSCNIRSLMKRHFIFTISPIILFPIFIKKHAYLKICALHNKLIR